MSARKTLLTLLVAVTAAVASHSANAGPWIPAPDEYYCEFSGVYGTANSFFDDDGTRNTYLFKAFDEQRSLVSYNELGWKNWASVAFEVPIVSRTVQFQDFRFDRTQTGIADLMFGFRFKLLDGATGLSLEAKWVGPAGYDRSSFPRLGPGQQNAGGGLAFGTPIGSRGFIQASAGYVHRFEAPLDRIAHSADVAFWLTPSLLVSGRYEGFMTQGSDTAGVEMNAYTVGPELRYRVDDRMDLFAGSRHTPKGKNVDKFDQFYVGLALKQTRLNRLQGYLGGKRRN